MVLIIDTTNMPQLHNITILFLVCGCSSNRPPPPLPPSPCFSRSHHSYQGGVIWQPGQIRSRDISQMNSPLPFCIPLPLPLSCRAHVNPRAEDFGGPSTNPAACLSLKSISWTASFFSVTLPFQSFFILFEVVLPTRHYDLRPGATIYLALCKGIKQETRYRTPSFHRLPPSKWRTQWACDPDPSTISALFLPW